MTFTDELQITLQATGVLTETAWYDCAVYIFFFPVPWVQRYGGSNEIIIQRSSHFNGRSDADNHMVRWAAVCVNLTMTDDWCDTVTLRACHQMKGFALSWADEEIQLTFTLGCKPISKHKKT